MDRSNEVTPAAMSAFRSDLQGLVQGGMELEDALAEAVEANLNITVTSALEPEDNPQASQ